MNRTVSSFLFLLLCSWSWAVNAAPTFTVENYTLESKQRVSRTEFEYTYNATIDPVGTVNESGNVTANLTSSGPNTVVLEGQLSANFDKANISHNDTQFTIRHDRRFSFDPNTIQWAFNVVVDDDPSGNTDQDNDGISDTIEEYFGTDTSNNDTDGDGLYDNYELLYGFPDLDPKEADTNNNGVNDGAEDTDGDGLSNLQEQELKTSPLEKDTDRDGLDDYSEIDVHETNPLIEDTDGDGIIDGREIENSSNPLVPDADRVVTSQKTFVTYNPLTGKEESVSISIQGAGDLASEISVNNWSDIKIKGQVGRSFDISFIDENKPFESADITFSYDVDDPKAADLNNLSVFTINPESNFWEELPSIVDPFTGTITATTTHFSPFLVGNSSEFNEAANNIPTTCSDVNDPDALVSDVVLTIDSSGSMQSNDPNNLRISAARQFTQSMKEGDKVAVVDFDSFGKILIGLSTDQVSIAQALERINSSGSTNIGQGVAVSINELIDNSKRDNIRAIILLTDGQGAYDQRLTGFMAQEGIRVFTIALGNAADEALLRSISEGTNGSFTYISSADGLANIFNDLETVFGDDGADDDQDGLTNCQEIQGFTIPELGNRLIYTDPNNPDTDGDGVSDGAEAGNLVKANQGTQTLWMAQDAASNPEVGNQDTDGDGILDPDEYRFSTNAFSVDSDRDNLTDFEEIETHETSPNNPDSDGDELSDSYEVANSDQGFDPNVFTYNTGIKNRLLFLGAMTKGAVLGDIVNIDTPPELYGQIAGSFFVVTDIRDFVANLFRGEWLNAGISAAGLVPAVGDVSAAVARISNFIVKFPRARYEVISLLGKHFASGSQVRSLGDINLARLLPPPPKAIGAWALKPFARGKALEQPIGNILKQSDITLIGLYGNFPVIDMWSKTTGKAVSIKTLDLNAKSYQNASNFRSTVNRDAKKLAEFDSRTGYSVELGTRVSIMRGEVKSRELIIGISRPLDDEFLSILQDLERKYGFSIKAEII